ncbi:unnamed protein product [Caenorhabditis brenneri]
MEQSIRIKMMDKQYDVDMSGNSENSITENNIKRLFLLPPDAIVQLLFERNGIKTHCRINEAGDTFLLPSSWPTMEFFVQSFRPPTPIYIQERELALITPIKNFWEDKVFRVFGNKLTGTCVLINDRRVLTAAHLSFTLNGTYTIKGTGNREFSVTCVFICKRRDIAILESDALPTLELPIDSLVEGSKYFIMGYPNGVDSSIPTITTGTTKGFMDDHIHQVGTPGPKRGYSCAPVFNDSGDLAGLLLGGTSGISDNRTIQECLDSSAEQKYARILAIDVINFRYSRGESDSES